MDAHSLRAAVNLWRSGKSAERVAELVDGILALTEQPLVDLPGESEPGLYPMRRWVLAAGTRVSIRVYEPQGKFDVVYIEDY